MKDAYYFSHDSNAKDDPKCVLLIEQLGLEGYGIYWVLVEVLREQPAYKYPINLLPALARRFNTTHEKVKAVVFSYELFTIENEMFFFSQSLNERMQVLSEKRFKKSLAGKTGNQKRWGQLAEVSQCDNNAIAEVSQCIASKAKKSKEEYIVCLKNEFSNQIKLLFPNMTDWEKKELNKFYLYWSEPNKSQTKIKWQLQPTWDLKMRTNTWFKNAEEFEKNRKQ